MKKSIQYFWHYLKEYKFHLFLVLVGVCASTYFIVKAPEVSGAAINELGAIAMGKSDKSEFMKLVLILAVFAVLAWIFSLLQNFVMTKVSGLATDTMRKDLFSKLETLPIRYFDQTSDGEILSRFTSDLDNISNTLNQSIHEIMINLAMLLLSIFMMFRAHVELSFVVLSTSPLVVIVAVFVIKRAKHYMNVQQKEVGKMNGYVDERFAGQKLVIANGLQEESKETFMVHNEAVYQATFKGQLYSNILFPALMGLSMLTTAIVIFYGAWMSATGRLELSQAAGTVFLFTQYTRMIYQPLSQIASQYTQMQLAFTGATRIIEILEEDPEQDRPGVVDIDGIHGDVLLEDVSFGYDEGQLVLHNVNISAQKGEMIALVGHTGSGKTTIMNLLNRFYNVESGIIRFDGRDIRDISLPSLRENVGIVLQDSVLFTGTIRDNIAFGKKEASYEEVVEVAKRANIHDFIMSLEAGYDTEVSESNSRMSVGQKQLISIARTMLIDPDFLILDEATSNVDTVTESHIQKAMDEVTKGRTSFVIAHRLKTILEADRIIVLRQGKIIEEGTHESLLESKGHYASLYENQFVFGEQ